MVQEESVTPETAKDSSTKKKVSATASKYDAVQESDPSVLTVYKFTSRYGRAKEYKVAAESLRSAARLVGVKADSVTQTGVEAYTS
tara:strand:+ start:1414 stop:1671 length:258 start_codon:yes stop_codon:yes gene_type:complete